MRSVILATAILAMLGTSSALARGKHRHHHQAQHHSTATSSTPAKANARAPEKRDPEDTKIDRRIRSICRGC
jgi:hypothetical protein